MNNHHTPTRSPTARCKSFAALLPLLDEPDMDADALAEARAHLAACAYCQQQRAAYRQLEAAAVRYLSPPAAPCYRTEEIMRDLLGEPAAEAINAEAPTPTTLHPLPRKPTSARCFVSNLTSFAAVLVIVILAVTLFANRAHLLGGNVSGTPTPGAGLDTELLDVAMVSPTEGWAVGYSTPTIPFVPCATPSDPSTEKKFCAGKIDLDQETVVMMHYVHGAWVSIHLPIHGQLTRISMLSATDGWAVGWDSSTTLGLILHYDGHSWKQVPGPMNSYGFSSLQMLSDTDGWATDGWVVHYDGHRWTAQPIPASLEPDKNPVQLQSVSMTSPNEGWAVGVAQKPILQGTPPPPNEIDAGVILHYLNGQWSLYRLIHNAMLKDVQMTSPDDGWIAGSNEAGDGSPILLHYTHGTWTQVPNPLSAAESRSFGFERIFMRSPTDGWMTIGTGVNFQKSDTLRYDGSQWKVDRLPIIPASGALEITSISMTSANDGWAVGSRLPATVSVNGNRISPAIDPLLLHYQNGAWHIYNNS